MVRFFADLGMTPVQRVKHLYVTRKFSSFSKRFYTNSMLEKNENAVTATSKGRPTTINKEKCEAAKKAVNPDRQLVEREIL